MCHIHQEHGSSQELTSEGQYRPPSIPLLRMLTHFHWKTPTKRTAPESDLDTRHPYPKAIANSQMTSSGDQPLRLTKTRARLHLLLGSHEWMK